MQEELQANLYYMHMHKTEHRRSIGPPKFGWSLKKMNNITIPKHIQEQPRWRVSVCPRLVSSKFFHFNGAFCSRVANFCHFCSAFCSRAADLGHFGAKNGRFSHFCARPILTLSCKTADFSPDARVERWARSTCGARSVCCIFLLFFLPDEAGN